jgi:cytochrome P450
MSGQPASTLSVASAFAELDQATYNLGDEHYILDPWQALLVKRDLNAALENIMVGLSSELKYALEARWGSDTEEWKEFNVLKTMKLVIAQGSSRFTVGLPLCMSSEINPSEDTNVNIGRNEQYLIDTVAWNDLFMLGAGGIGMLPRLLRPIIGPFFSIPIRYRSWKIKQSFKPEFKKRLELIKNPKSENDPQDHLQLMMRFAQSDRPNELNINDMTNRLHMANFGSYHQTSMAMANILLNIIASNKEHNTIAVLREEVSTILAAHNNTWSKAAVSQMIKADSVCRETLRINSFGNRSILRQVMVSDFKTEDGILLPKGEMVSIMAHGAQVDSTIFQNPLSFDPFRFSRIREEDKSTNVSFVSTGPQFLPFGHGKFACPGRFLLDFEFKMMIAYIVSYYEIEFPVEYKGVRPVSEWMAEATLPPSEGRIRVRRRKESAI